MIRIKRVCALYFSPCWSTAKVCRLLGEELSSALSVDFETYDFTTPSSREGVREYGEGDLVVFGVPTYAGRIPNKILPYVQSNISGGGALAVPIVTFGNRSPDSSLDESIYELSNAGFTVIGAASVCSRHVFSDLLAPGRPDGEDHEKLRQLAAEIIHKTKSNADLTTSQNALKPDKNKVMPYYVPKGEDGEPVNFLKAKPITNTELCVHCGACARACPMGAIDRDEESNVSGTCIKCHACVRRCKAGAKSFSDKGLLSHIRMLEANFSDGKETKIFF